MFEVVKNQLFILWVKSRKLWGIRDLLMLMISNHNVHFVQNMFPLAFQKLHACIHGNALLLIYSKFSFRNSLENRFILNVAMK